eukprot:scaffold115029_cov31-Tisochrysis_lutea.AAC.1
MARLSLVGLEVKVFANTVEAGKHARQIAQVLVHAELERVWRGRHSAAGRWLSAILPRAVWLRARPRSSRPFSSPLLLVPLVAAGGGNTRGGGVKRGKNPFGSIDDGPLDLSEIFLARRSSFLFVLDEQSADCVG